MACCGACKQSDRLAKWNDRATAYQQTGQVLSTHQEFQGDANMRSAWICTRNDVLGNLAVLLAALGVFGTGTGWPDVIVATIMAGLAIQGAILVIRQAAGELQGIASVVKI